MIFGSVLKQSTILRYLPAYFDFADEEAQEREDGGATAAKQSKRQRVMDKQEKFTQLLKPLNICGCDFESVPDPDLQQLSGFNQKMKLDSSGKKEGTKLYKKIDGEYFIDETATKFELRHLNIIDICDVDVVLASTFSDLYGLPFITRLPDFKGRVLMTLPMAQIGYHLVLELVHQNARRNLQKDSGCAYLRQEKLHEVFAREGIEEWQELYTEQDVEDCFNKHVTVLNYNEVHTVDNFMSFTAISSGYHIGAANWLVTMGTQRFGILRNSTEEGEFRHPLALNLEPF